MTKSLFLNPPRGSFSVLVVQPGAEVFVTGAMLSEAGFQVTVAGSYQKAKALLTERRPRILVTDVRLADYNGLHLVLRGNALRSSMAALVLAPWDDPVIRRDAEQLGATFMVKPVPARELLAAVRRMVSGGAGNQVPMRPPFDRRLHERRNADVITVTTDRRAHDRREPTAIFVSKPSPFH